MDILQKLSLNFSSEFKSLVIKEVRVFERSLLVETNCGALGLSSNIGECKDSTIWRGLSARSFIEKIDFNNFLHRSILLALINAFNSRSELVRAAPQYKAHHIAYDLPADSKIAVIGRFPFVHSFVESRHFSTVAVFELNPQAGEFGVDDYHTLKDFDLVLITAMTLANNTFDDVMSFIPTSTKVILLGPTSPMLPELLKHGVSVIAGAVVVDGENLKLCLSAGKSFRSSTGLKYCSISK